MPSKLKASSKFGRNKVKCANYAARNTKNKNAIRRDETQARRWQRDNRQRIERLTLVMASMLDAGVDARSTAYGDVRRQRDHACTMRDKWL